MKRTKWPHLYQVRRSDLPSHTYLIVNKHSQTIHFDPTITDFELYRLSTKCNETFLRRAHDLGLFRTVKANGVCELILVSGGFYYHLNQAFYNVFGYSLPAGFIGVRRVLEPRAHAMISYDNLEAIPYNGIAIIGDTVATGATLVDSITYFLKKVSERHLHIKKIVVFTIAGALPGLQRLAVLEKEIKEKYHTSLHVFLSEAIFGLAKNQTDMHYFHPDTIMPDEVCKAAERRLGKFLGERLCVIWDWGQRNKDPMGHLRAVIRVCARLGPTAAKIVKKAKRILQKRENAL